MTQETLKDSGIIKREKREVVKTEYIKPLWTGGEIKVIKENESSKE